MSANSDPQVAIRGVRLEIGRLRRRIDRRIDALGRQGRQAVSWRGWIRRYPVYALAAAFGIGLAASTLYRRGHWARALGLQLARRAADRILNSVVREFSELWSRSAPAKEAAGPGVTSGDEHGRT
jgi:hypothetical protein